jgi:hypothetical protein
MSASSGTNGYLVDWRNSFSLVRNNLYCNKGRTFRGAHPSVQSDGFAPNSCITAARTDAGRGAGTAKPGPTTDTSSRIARIKKLQTRTRTSKGQIDNGGTDRGAHASVQNGQSYGADPRSKRAQLFGNYGEVVPGQTSGRGGSSSDVIYFKNVFDRTSLNQPAANGNN